MTKDGLTGSSGYLITAALGLLHVANNYAARKDGCFIEVADKDGYPRWKRVSIKAAERRKCRIIKCTYCDKPAISLDHYWPYHNEANYCADHRNWRELAEEKEKAEREKAENERLTKDLNPDEKTP